MNLIPASISSALLSLSESSPPEIASEHARFLDARLMIVDDEPINVKVVRKHLQNAGYKNFVSTSDATQAMNLLRSEQPDAVVLDIMMPEVNGLEILKWIREDNTFRHTPVLILTASSDAPTKLAALENGATDFLAKPVDPHELLPRLRNILTVKAHQDYLAGYSIKLEREVQKRTAEVEMSRLRVIQCLARAGEYRDDATGRHVIRVGRCATIVASQLGYSTQRAAMIELAAQLHDIGKIGIPDAILLKPGKLTAEETSVMRKHCEYGKAIIEPTSATEAELGRKYADLGLIVNQFIDPPVLRMAADIAISHHERIDGSGYPFGIRGDSIPHEGRITALVDVFDALHTVRPYKPAYGTDRCLEILRAGGGTQFDASVLEAFVSRINDIEAVYIENAD
jgi:putative two-component system response regulator